MSTDHFTIEEHVIAAQHIRNYHNGLKYSQEDVLRLAVKVYRPKTPPPSAPKHPAITIIAGHAIGFPKEAYEPVWDDLLVALRARGSDIRSVWFADAVNMGASGILNEALIGDDTSWFDHSRDLLSMVNAFRSEMVRPIIGIAHSMGSAQLVHLAILHPRLLSGLVLCEPVIQNGPAKGPNAAYMATVRPDLWRTREEAAAPYYAARIFQAWDHRVVKKIVEHSFRETPTALYPAEKAAPGSVTLTTTKHQEAWSFLRANFAPLGDPEFDRRIDPDLSRSFENDYILFRPECSLALIEIQHVRPPVFWIFGGKSIMSPPAWIETKLSTTGIGVGGNGGVKNGKVHHVVFPDANHFVIFEQLGKVVAAVSDWLGDTAIPEFEKDVAFWKGYGSMTSKNDMREMSDLWVKTMKGPAGEKRSRAESSKL